MNYSQTSLYNHLIALIERFVMQFNNPTFIQILIVLALVGLSLLVSATVPGSVRANANIWLQELEPKVHSQLESFDHIEATDLERDRLKDQFSLARDRARHHLTVAIYFFSNYYMAILQAFVMGMIAAIALFFITQVGYAQASSTVVTVFITATALATFYGGFPSVFRQTDNVAENKALYLRYISLQNEMLSYAATGMDSTPKKFAAADYIACIDKGLNKINNIAVCFDASKIPVVKFDIK